MLRQPPGKVDFRLECEWCRLAVCGDLALCAEHILVSLRPEAECALCESEMNSALLLGGNDRISFIDPLQNLDYDETKLAAAQDRLRASAVSRETT
jgi:hypothetical protein